MKELIKKLIPDWLLRKYRILSKYNRSSKIIFTEIYNNNQWKSTESISGPGSEINQTESLINSLDKLLKDFNIVTLLDIPCGDFNWMCKVDLSKIEYTGADIVKELIKSNISLYNKGGNINFKILNLIKDPLPESDMIIVRDCLVHLSYKDIDRAVKNIKSSDSRYLLTTTFTDHHQNHDIETGDWRPLNLQEAPFSFSTPILIINEDCTEENGKYKDKSLALWDISKI